MKNFLVYAKYDKETGISKVWIKNKYGVFMAKSRLRPEDKDFASEYIGCHFAEMKANIKAYKKHKQDLQLREKELLYFQKILEQTKGYNVSSVEAKKLRKRLYIIGKEIKNVQNKIDELNIELQEEIKHRDEGTKLLKKIYENRKNPQHSEEQKKFIEALANKLKDRNSKND